jgi:hypothetical protein
MWSAMRPAALGPKLMRRFAGLPRVYREVDRSLTLLGDLRKLGWQNSARLNAAVDANRRPLPWYTYPAIFWLAPKIRPQDDVFEFGAGQSTLWFAERVRRVVAVDHDEAWVRRLTAALPSTGLVVLRDEREYVTAISEFVASGDGFDVIAIDGIRRSECAREVPKHLKPSGLVLFDNSDRPENYDGLEFLRSAGFRRIDFIGPIPGYGNIACTSALFQDGNRWLAGDDLPAFLGY